jgi:hypothetical protein
MELTYGEVDGFKFSGEFVDDGYRGEIPGDPGIQDDDVYATVV